MSYRVHTAEASSTLVQHGTDVAIDEAMGYDNADDDTTQRIIFNDVGNMEAFVLRGDRESLRAFGQRIVDMANDTTLNFG